MNRFFRVFVITVLIVTGVTFFLLGSSPNGGEERKQELETLKITYIPVLGDRDMWIAQERGFFTEMGLKVEFVKIPETARTTALAQGKIDGGHLAPPETLMAVSRGLKVKQVIAYGYRAPMYIAVFKESNFKSIRDLEGKILGVSHIASAPSLAIEEELKTWGVKARLVPLGIPEKIAALLGGKVDAIWLSNTEFRMFPEKFRKVHTVSAWAKVNPGVGYYFRADLLERKPGLIKKWLKAIEKARRFDRENPVEGMRIGCRWCNIPAEMAGKMANTWKYDDEMTVHVGALEHMQKMLLHIGKIDKPIEIEKDVVDTRFTKVCRTCESNPHSLE